LNRLQRRLQNRFGPEGLGEENDADDEEIPDDQDPADIERLGEEAERHETQRHSAESAFGEGPSTNPIPEDPRLAPVTSGILLSVASTARDCILEDSSLNKITTGVHPVLRSLTSGTAAALSSIQHSQVNPNTSASPLILAAKRCHVMEILDASIQLNYWVNVIIFASQVTR
jgi:hypothetical protein